MNENVLSLIKDQLTDLFKSYDQFQGMYKSSVLTLFKKFLSHDKKEFPENTSVNIKGRRFEISSSFINSDGCVILSGRVKCMGSCCNADYSSLDIDLEKLDTPEIIEIAKIILPIV